MKQYAASPTIQRLTSDRASYFPVMWQDQFYNIVWNVDTAQGFGLDVWGRIVVIGRNIEIPNGQGYFGFSDGTSPPDWQPFNQGTFNNGAQATQTFTLGDDAYRVLILTKALANISSVDAKSMNRILQNLFPGRGRSYVNDLGSMQMRYTFEFELEPWEQTILVSGGALPRPAGVKAFVATIPTGDASTFGFAEQGIGQVVADPTPQVFRNDWQGNQLLYTTPRTNLALRSQEFNNAYWSKARASVTADAALAPDGTATADKLVEDSTNNTHLLQRSITATGSSTYTWSVFVKAAERTFASIRIDGVGAQVAFNTVNIDLATGTFTATDLSRTQVVSVGGGWFRVSTTTTTIPAGGTLFPGAYIATSLSTTGYLGDGVSGIYIWQGDFVASGIPSSAIPTIASPVTVTDYSATSTAVTLSSPLLPDATLLWTGTYTNQLTGQQVLQSQAAMGAGTGATSVYPFSGTFTPNTVAPFNQGTFLSTGAVNNAA